jgi:hypothetical protein
MLVVIPGNRRGRLREDFAFEFLAYARFLGVINAGGELQVHDAITSAIADHQSGPLVFSISGAEWAGDLDHCLSLCVEKIAVTLCHWLEDEDQVSNRRGPRRLSEPAGDLLGFSQVEIREPRG